ncbi:MAG: hypothetical protein AAB775_00315 [Patescibacteria group bacterium]
MYIIKAIPIARGTGLDILSYWSPKNIGSGSIIRAPLRKKTVAAVVISSESAVQSKSEVRRADFPVRKIANPRGRTVISPEFFKTAENMARYYASSMSNVLFELLPAIALSQYEKLPPAVGRTARNRPRESFVLQKNDEDRFAHYKSLIREGFARRESVFMMMPTIEDIKKACSYFEKGVEPYTYVFHGSLSKNEIIKRWREVMESKHPLVIAATGQYLSIPREDIGIVIAERESSRNYKSQSRPHLDFRRVAEQFAREIGADFIAGDSCLRIETLHRHDLGELAEYAPLSMRSLSTARDSLIDMKSYKNPEHKIRLLSDELVAMAQKNRDDNGLLFVFAGRRGLSPQTVCTDCETILSCDLCSAPLVLYGRDAGRFFLCNKCGKKFSAEETCRKCGGWRLATLGIGTEKIEAELRSALPGAKVFRLDKISAPTHKKASLIAEKWYASPGSILVGTEMALLYLDRSIDYGAVASLDALFSIPDFRINEKIFSVILKMRSITQKQFLLQTRSPETDVLVWGVKGNIMDFYRHEIENRKKFSFPPFSTFIKISFAGKKDEVLKAMEKLRALLAGFHVDVFPAFIATVRGNYIMHALVKLSPGEWIHTELLDRLKTLPPQYAINVDPESIL